eukprot:362120-Chlamydomonas_euryale.AAC.15
MEHGETGPGVKNTECEMDRPILDRQKDREGGLHACSRMGGRCRGMHAFMGGLLGRPPAPCGRVWKSLSATRLSRRLVQSERPLDAGISARSGVTRAAGGRLLGQRPVQAHLWHARACVCMCLRAVVRLCTTSKATANAIPLCPYGPSHTVATSAPQSCPGSLFVEHAMADSAALLWGVLRPIQQRLNHIHNVAAYDYHQSLPISPLACTAGSDCQTICYEAKKLHIMLSLHAACLTESV